MAQTTHIRARSFVLLFFSGGLAAFAITALQELGVEPDVTPARYITNSEAPKLEVVPHPRPSPQFASDHSGTALAFAPHGKFAAIAHTDGSLGIRASDGSEALSLEVPGGRAATYAAFSPDGRLLLSGGSDSDILGWDLETGLKKYKLRGHESNVSAIAFSGDGSTIASAARETRIFLWDAEAGRLRAILTGHHDFVNDIAFGPVPGQIVSASADGKVLLWDADSGAILRTIEGSGQPVTKIGIAANGTLAAGAIDGSVVLWNAARGTEHARLVAHRAAITALTFSHDGKHLATASADNQVAVWIVASGQLLATSAGPVGPNTSLSFDSAGRLLVGGSSGDVAVWDFTERATPYRVAVKK